MSSRCALVDGEPSRRGFDFWLRKEDPCRNLVYRSAAGGGAGLPRCEQVGLRGRVQGWGEEGRTPGALGDVG